MHTTYNVVFMRYYNCSSKLFALLVYGIDLFSFSCFTASCSADSFCCCCTSLCGSTSQEEVIKSTNVLNLSTYSALSTGVAAAAPDLSTRGDGEVAADPTVVPAFPDSGDGEVTGTGASLTNVLAVGTSAP